MEKGEQVQDSRGSKLPKAAEAPKAAGGSQGKATRGCPRLLKLFEATHGYLQLSKALGEMSHLIPQGVPTTCVGGEVEQRGKGD